MSEVKKDNSRGYQLVLVPYMGGEDYRKCLFEKCRLEEIDYFTGRYEELNDMIKDIKKSGLISKEIEVVNAYIERVGGSHRKFNIAYRNDNYDADKVIDTYVRFLIEHPEICNKSRDIPPFIKKESDKRGSLFSYYHNGKDMYRKARGAYFSLKENHFHDGIYKKKTVDREEEYHMIESGNDYFDMLYNKVDGPDWDAIYNLYSTEEVEKMLKGNSRGLHR